MTPEELVSIIDSEIAQSVGYYSGKLASDRKTAMEYYYGEPFGDEQEGQSTFVSQDVADTVEWIMPALMKIFASSENICRFDPVGPEDEPGAKQATDYATHVFTKKNPGFVILYSLFKDALLQKNGFTKTYWEDYQTRSVHSYSNLEPGQLEAVFQALSQQGEVGVLTASEDSSEVTFEVKNTTGKICVDPVPPDEILVSKNATWDLQKARCVTHRSTKSASEIREMGYQVPKDVSSDGDDFGLEKQVRFLQEQDDVQDDENRDPSSWQYQVDESYILVDFDGDGLAERRMVVKIGKHILKNEKGEEANYEIDFVPLSTATPILMPHKLFGRSVAELIMDLQRLKSELIRQILNNLRLTNNSRVMALDGMVNIDDLLTVRPGGVVRVKTFDAVKPMQIPFFGAPAFDMLGYVDQVRENRTGARYFQGIDPNALSKDTSGVAMANIINSSMERIELIARIFAETGVKDIFKKIYDLAIKHVKKAEWIKLRNEWIPVDPTGWNSGYDLTVTVGLGTGSKEQFLQAATVLGEIQKSIVEGGGLGRVVTEENIYNLAHYTAEAVAPKKADLFFTDPKKLGPPEEKPDPKIEMQREKAYLADKTKRDTAAVTFLTEIAKLQKTEPKQDDSEKFEHERTMQQDKFRAERETQATQHEHEADMKAAELLSAVAGELNKSMEAMTQYQEQMQASQQQLMQAMEQLAKLASSERELVFDDKGDPVRSRLVA